MHYETIDPKFLETFFEYIQNANDIIITSHFSPDDDSIASVLSLYVMLSAKYQNEQDKLGKKIRIMYSGEPALRFKVLPFFEKIEFVPEIVDAITETDVLIMLDGGQFYRFSQKPEILKTLAKKTICIDHHASAPDIFDLSIILKTAPSAAEVLYKIFFDTANVNQENLSPEIAKLLLVGILGDTGNFAFLKPNQTETFTIAKRLVEIAQVEIQELQASYRGMTDRIFTLIKELIKNTNYYEVAGWPSVFTSFISREFQDAGNYTQNEVGSAKDIFVGGYATKIENHPWGFVIVPKPEGNCSISLRSLPHSVNVRVLVEKMEIGGGHDRAAGGLFKKTDTDLSSEECIQKVINWMENNTFPQ